MARRVLTAEEAVANAQTLNLSRYRNQRPVLVGPLARLFRYTVPGERVSIGTYTFTDTLVSPWPNLPEGSAVDLSFVKVYLESARIRYLNKPIGLNGTAIPPAAPANRVRASDLIFRTANGFNRSPIFGDRDVEVGDLVRLSADPGGGMVTHTTRVTGFRGDPVAASIGNASASSINKPSTAGSPPVYQQAGSTPLNEVYITAVDDTGYDSLADGGLTRTYTVTVLQSSNGGDATTAVLRVQSSDGKDDVASVTPAAFGSPTTIGTKGLTVTWGLNALRPTDAGVSPDDFVAGQKWTITLNKEFTAASATSGGTYTGDRKRVYIVTITVGGTLASGTAAFVVTTADGSDMSGPTLVTGAGDPRPVGNFGATITFSGAGGMLNVGDVWSFTATPETEGVIRTLVLRDDVPESLRSGSQDCHLELMIERPSVELPRFGSHPSSMTNWRATSDELTVSAGIHLTAPGLTAGGVPAYHPVVSATVYPHYRVWITRRTPERYATYQEALAGLGSLDSDNPLGYAVARALDNTAGSLLVDPSPTARTTTDVIVVQPLPNLPHDLSAWQEALDTLATEPDAYRLVPITHNPAVHRLFADYAIAASSGNDGYWRTCFLPGSVESYARLVPGDSSELMTATVSAGTNGNNLVTAEPGANFVTRGVRPGDRFHVNIVTDQDGNSTYNSFIVAEVVSETTLHLASGPAAPIPVAVQFEIWRPMTSDDLVEQILRRVAEYASERICLIWPDAAIDEASGQEVPGYSVASAVAGLAASVPSQQSLRGVGVKGFRSAPRSLGLFTAAQLNRLAAAGVFILQTDPEGGIFVRDPHTTNPASVETREEMVTRNSDMVRFAVDAAWMSLRGISNLTDEIQEQLQGRLDQTSLDLRASNTTRLLGPPCVGLRIAGASPVPGQPDSLNVSVEMTGPLPLNRTFLDMSLI